MRSLSRTPTSRTTSGKLLESAASAEAHRLPVHPEPKRTREYRGQKFPLGRKVAHRCSHFVAIAAHAPLRAHVNHRAGQRRLIQLDKLWRRPERARSFVDHNKMCT